MEIKNKSPGVAIVIPNFNGVQIKFKNTPILKLALDSLKITKYNNYVVFVSDDHSGDVSIKFVKRHYSNVSIISSKKHGWYVGAANNALRIILKQSKFKYVLFMNNDMIIKDPFWLTKMIDVIEGDSTIGAEGCQLLYPTGLIQWAGMSFGKFKLFPHSLHRGERQKKILDVVKETYVASGIMLVRTELFRKFGIFDANFKMGGEETDFCIRMRNNGYRVVYNGRVKVIHLESFTVTEYPDPKVKEMAKYLGMVSYIYFLRKNFSIPKQFLGLIALLGKSVFMLNRSEKDRIKSSESHRSVLFLRVQDEPLRQIYLALRAIKGGYLLKLNGKNLGIKEY